MFNRELSFHKTQPARNPSSDSSRTWTEYESPFAVVENDDEVAIRTDLPGLSGGEVSVRCENGVLHVSGGKVGVNEKRVGHFRSRENWAELLSRSLELGKHMDWSHADASLRDGVLTVKLRKTASATSPRMEIPVH